jgi:hypothetical protein
MDQRPAVHDRIRMVGECLERPLLTLSGPIYEVRGKLERVILHAFSPCVVILIMGRCIALWCLLDVCSA